LTCPHPAQALGARAASIAEAGARGILVLAPGTPAHLPRYTTWTNEP